MFDHLVDNTQKVNFFEEIQKYLNRKVFLFEDKTKLQNSEHQRTSWNMLAENWKSSRKASSVSDFLF